jgi:hypothetical protein
MRTIKGDHVILNISGWRDRDADDILVCLSQTVNVFKAEITPKLFNKKAVLVENYTDTAFSQEHPKMYKVTPENRIYLNINADNDAYANYVLQFAHEYGHHLLDCDFYNTHDQFGWFEEVLCEVAGLYALHAVSKECDSKLANELQAVLQDILNDKTYHIDMLLAEWIAEKQELLSLDRYFRTHNKTIAIKLAPLFFENSKLWDTMLLIKQIPVAEEMSFDVFIDVWENLMSSSAKSNFQDFKAKILI